KKCTIIIITHGKKHMMARNISLSERAQHQLLRGKKGLSAARWAKFRGSFRGGFRKRADDLFTVQNTRPAGQGAELKRPAGATGKNGKKQERPFLGRGATSLF